MNQPNSKSILIVDDEVALAKAIELKLQKAGFHTMAVFSGTDCVNEIHKNHYDLLLLDIMMPSVDGWTVLETIQKENLKIKIIITTNLSQTEDKEKAKSFGAVDYLVKSDSTLESIVQRIKELLT